MAYIDIHLLESELDGITKHRYLVVALAGMDGSVGELVSNQFGLDTDMEALAQRTQRPFTRLLVGVENPRDPAAVERVRQALSWPSYPPF
ncbi:MAG: hypothetical protein EON59_05755 [Alphaproteobacteria bacterium]|nr:MAG: hypothetical protein EON59_05755 [Alphaproteobacteria bacterium]